MFTGGTIWILTHGHLEVDPSSACFPLACVAAAVQNQHRAPPGIATFRHKPRVGCAPTNQRRATVRAPVYSLTSAKGNFKQSFVGPAQAMLETTSTHSYNTVSPEGKEHCWTMGSQLLQRANFGARRFGAPDRASDPSK